MSEFHTIIVIGAGKILPAELIAEIKHSHGQDMIVISSEEAKEKGIIPEAALKIEQKPFIIKPIPKMPEAFYDKHQAKNDCKKGWRNK